MRYSGLIYAAIVACWAAVLVPRWIRRNEEVEHAREEDAARGIRVLERERRTARAAHAGPRLTQPSAHPSGRPDGRSAEPLDEEPEREAPAAPTEFSLAARRRRRVLTILLLTLAATVTGAMAGALATGWVVAVSVALVVFLALARRAAVTDARRRARTRRIARLRAAQSEASRPSAGDAEVAGDDDGGQRKRVAVLDEPAPAEPLDPDAWEPVPVPLPTYLSKAKAAPLVARKIDLSSPGAWTSGRLNPAGSIAMPPPKPALPAGEPEPDEAELSELPEHRRAVGD